MRYTERMLCLLSCLSMLQCAANVMKIRGSSYEKHKDFSDTQHVIDAAEKVPENEAAQVQVFLDEIPTGVKKTAGGLDLGGHWQILGNAEVYAGEANTIIHWWFWIIEYEKSDTFRRYYCNAQVPFKILTISVWILTPPYWVCYNDINLNKPEYIRQRKQLIAGQLQKITRAAGGDAVWIHTPLGEHVKFLGAKAMILKQK